MKYLFTKIQNLFPKTPQKRDFALLVCVCLIFLGYSFFSGVSKRRQIPPSQYLTNVLENPKLSVTFAKDFRLPEPAESLYIYEASIDSVPIATVASNLAQELGFDPGPTFIGLWQSADKNRYVIANQLNKNVQYSVDLLQSDKRIFGSSKPTLESAILSAVEFSQLLKELPPLSVIPEQTEYLKAGGGEYLVSNSENFDFIKIVLNPFLDSVPVKTSGFPNPVFTAFVGPESRVIKAVIDPSWVRTTSRLLQPRLFDRKEIEKSIRQGQITQINPGPEIIIHSYDLIQVEIISATLEYHYSPLKRLLVPSYNLQARVLTKNKVSSTAQIAVPAADTP